MPERTVSRRIVRKTFGNADEELFHASVYKKPRLANLGISNYIPMIRMKLAITDEAAEK